MVPSQLRPLSLQELSHVSGGDGFNGLSLSDQWQRFILLNPSILVGRDPHPSPWVVGKVGL